MLEPASLALAIRDAATRFHSAQQAFRLTHGQNAYPERTVSHYYIDALRSVLGDAQVLLGVPIAGRAATRRDNHLDALVFNARIAVLCEFKRVWSPSHWQWIADDVARIGSGVVPEIASRFRSTPDSPPRQLLAFFGADCWRQNIAAAWGSGVPVRRWVLPAPLRSMDRGTHTVWQASGEDFDGYYLTWAVTSLPTAVPAS